MTTEGLAKFIALVFCMTIIGWWIAIAIPTGRDKVRTVQARELRPGDQIVVSVNKVQNVKAVELNACTTRKVHVNGTDCYDENAEVTIR